MKRYEWSMAYGAAGGGQFGVIINNYDGGRKSEHVVNSAVKKVPTVKRLDKKRTTNEVKTRKFDKCTMYGIPRIIIPMK